MTNSNWQISRQQSTYHFDCTRNDSPEKVMSYLGHIEPTWTQDLPLIVAQSRPATWATRGYKGEGIEAPPEELEREEYDLISNGMPRDLPITHLTWRLPESLQRISDAFALENCMNRIHIQRPGEVWNLHIDKLQKWDPDHPESIMRIMIQLTDWRPGQFWQYGNYNYHQWRAGDVTTFDWANIPHATANAGFDPRVTLQLTGIRTAATMDYLAALPL
jgi:hypothetical protein